MAEREPAAGNEFENAGAGVDRDVAKGAVAQVAVEHFPLAVARFGAGVADFRVDVAVAQQNIGPAVVIEIEKRRAPAEKTRVAAQARLKRGVVESVVAQVVIEAGSVAGGIRLDDVEPPR